MVLFLVAALTVAYVAFAGIIRLASTTRRFAMVHSIATGVTLIWLVLLLTCSTVTESG